MLAAARRGPKGATRSASADKATPIETVKRLAATLNGLHAFFYAAQRDREHKGRRDRASALIAELREIMPAIVKDAGAQRLKVDEFFSQKAERAAQTMCDFITGDVPFHALPEVTLPETVTGWQWCATALRADLESLLGARAAARFIAAAAQLLSGERPSVVSVARLFHKKK